MPGLADVFRVAGSAYSAARAALLLPSQRRAMHDILHCRTAAMGGSLYACDSCDSFEYRYHSCRNRHCPTCQEDRAQDWLTRLRLRMLPCDHYLLTFTLPAELRPLARAHQQEVYDALLRAAAGAVQTLAEDRQWIGGMPGILAVLHTWTRTLEYHPHVHLLVTAGGLSSDGAAWIKPANRRFLMPGRMLSQIFRAKMRDALVQAGLAAHSAPATWERRWVVHVQQIGRGEHAMKYLSRYVYRVAITNERIVRTTESSVTFRYVHAQTQQTREQTLPIQNFIARFLDHVLPAGFAKVRSYGLLSPAKRPALEQARRLLQQQQDALQAQTLAPTLAAPACTDASPAFAQALDSPFSCSRCHCGQLVLVHRLQQSRAPP
jgi:hypothetical protein